MIAWNEIPLKEVTDHLILPNGSRFQSCIGDVVSVISFFKWYKNLLFFPQSRDWSQHWYLPSEVRSDSYVMREIEPSLP